jgi:DNA-directed RNA polymerase specialized sigma24 family protein
MAYICKAIQRADIDAVRRDAAGKRGAAKTDSFEEGVDVSASDQHSPERHLWNLEVARAVEALLVRLTRTAADVLRCVGTGRMTHSEYAVHAGITPGNSRQLLLRARQEAKEKIKMLDIRDQEVLRGAFWES